MLYEHQITPAREYPYNSFFFKLFPELELMQNLFKNILYRVPSKNGIHVNCSREFNTTGVNALESLAHIRIICQWVNINRIKQRIVGINKK